VDELGRLQHQVGWPAVDIPVGEPPELPIDELHVPIQPRAVTSAKRHQNLYCFGNRTHDRAYLSRISWRVLPANDVIEATPDCTDEVWCTVEFQKEGP